MIGVSRSFIGNSARPGTLYIVATPIGNLEDITLRALRILKDVDLIACEDTRRTSRLLQHYGISTPRESYHEHNEIQKTPRLLAMLRTGKNIALVSDAGTPLVSDPGYRLVSECRKESILVTPIPGVSAAVAALSASGLPTDTWLFAGYPPARAGARREWLKQLVPVRSTLVIYEAPHRLLASLRDMISILGPRRACLAREVTKLHEEWVAGTLADILGSMANRSAIQGEITLVVDRGAAAPSVMPRQDSITAHLAQVISNTSMSQKEALKEVARARGIPRRDAYRQLLEERGR
ncbi:MAG: 16S rRNA (cytidine(1402)-2'-O)-methyltransferase [Acidobacteria bacterium]|nr:16S rRNA (cytidine(1402)-2'-O)-methyltransferase [Acidobacteriota bacterium]